MRFRTLCLAVCAATLLVFSFSPTTLHAAKKSKPEEAVTTATPTSWPPIPNLEFITRLRQEEFDYSQVMDLMSHLTDNIGARLTGSPNMKKANEWTRDELAKWGLANAHLEAWGTVWARLGLSALRSADDIARLHAIPRASRSLDAGHEWAVARAK